MKKRGCGRQSLAGKKAQGTIEFVILFGVALLFFVMITAAIQIDQSKKNKEKERLLLQNVALDVQDEINLAAESSEGYARNFTIPLNIIGRDYEINLSNDYVIANIDIYVLTYKIHNVTGQIQKGNNFIRKNNETVYLN